MNEIFSASAGLVHPLAQRSRNYSSQRQMSLSDLLLDNRIVFIGSSPETGGSPVITDFMANYTIQKLLYLVTENKSQDIHMYINSPGGSVSATLALYDTMQFIDCPVNTYCMGVAASGAAILLAAGAKGKRVLPTEQQSDDPPTVRPGRRAGVRHRNPGE